jgi:hypothetical protein
MGLGLGLGLQFYRRIGAAIDAQAQAHFDRVIADGGLVPSGLSGVNAFFTTIKTIYATADITTAISVGLDAQVLGYRLGDGIGTTAGQAAQKLYSCSGASGDVVQTTAASQPLLLVHSGENYYQGVGVINNQVSTPNAVANQITGDIDIKVELINYTAQSINAAGFLSKSTSGGIGSYVFTSQVAGTKTLGFRFWQAGVKSYNSTAEATITNGWVRVTRNQTTGDVIFYESTDGTNWTQIDATVSGVTGAMENGNEVLNIGTFAANGTPFLGKIKRVLISNSINGSAAVDFNPNQYNAATSQTQWTSSTGEIWSIQTGTAATGYKGQIVTKTILQGDGVDDRLSTNGLTNRTVLTKYVAEKFSGNAQYLCSNSSNSMLIYTNGSGVMRASSATEVIFSNTTRYTKTDLLTAVFDTSGITLVNNANQLTGDLSSGGTGTGLFLFSGSSGVFMCATINTYIESIGANNSTNRTSMYNYIRSINDNSF